MNHHPDCDVNDVNPDGIRKPCNCVGKGTLTDPRSDEGLNRIIALWRGWVCETQPDGFEHWIPPREAIVYSNTFGPPNYCTDLNACAEAEGKMDDGEYSFFMSMLMRQVIREGATQATYPRRLHSRTARQRAEALVKVIEDVTP